MSRIPSLRLPVITLILFAFAAIAVNAYWGGEFGFGLSAPEEAAKERSTTASQPLLMTTPLNAITSFDAAVIARHIVNAPAFANINQKCAADVSNNGAISSNDAALISRFVTGAGVPYGFTGTTVSPPCHANYQTTIPILKGEVSGQDPVSTGGVPGTIAVSLPVISGTPGTVEFPIIVDDTTGMDIESYDLQVSFDPSVIQPAATPYNQTGTRSSAMSVTPNAANPGHLIVGAFKFGALSGSGVLLYLRFDIVGTTGQSTALTFENYTDPAGKAHEGFMFNEATPSAATTNGSVSVGPNSATPTATYTPTFTPTPVAGSIPLSLPTVTGQVGYVVTVPITIGDTTGRGIEWYQGSVSWDPAVLQGMTPDANGTMSAGPNWIVTANMNNPGYMTLISETADPGSPIPLTGAGTLLNLKFLVVGSPGQSTALSFSGPTALIFGHSYTSTIPVFATPGSLTVIPASQTPTPSNTATTTPVGTPGSVPVPVSMPNVSAVEGSGITVPVLIGNTTGLGALSYDYQVTYDPAVLQPANPPIDRLGTLSETMIAHAGTNNSGHIIGGAFGHAGFTLYGSGTLINLRFTVVGTAGQSTALTFENYTDPGNNPHPGFALNEGDPASTTTNGSVMVGAAGGASIAGNVTYGNAIGGQATRFVPSVMVDGIGSTAVWTTTGPANGDYSLFGFGSGSYTVSPSKTGDLNGAISSFDAAKIAAQVVGAGVLTGNQLIVADVSGNGSVSSFDAGQIAAYVAGLPGTGTTGNWRFNPANRSYTSVSSMAGEDYTALLMGEVSGNWANTGGRPVVNQTSARNAKISVTAPRLMTSADTEILIPVAIQGAANKGIISYEFDLRYDPSMIQPEPIAADLARTVSSGFSVVTNAIEPGLLRVVVYGPMPITENGVLLNLRFTAMGKPGTASPLSFERIMFNEGEPSVNAVDGQVEIF